MSQPPNATIRAPSWRCRSSRGDRRPAGSGIEGNLARALRLPEHLDRLREAKADKEVVVVTLVQDLDAHLGVELLEPAHLAVLPRHEALVQRRQFDEQV